MNPRIAEILSTNVKIDFKTVLPIIKPFIAGFVLVVILQTINFSILFKIEKKEKEEIKNRRLNNNSFKDKTKKDKHIQEDNERN